MFLAQITHLSKWQILGWPIHSPSVQNNTNLFLYYSGEQNSKIKILPCLHSFEVGFRGRIHFLIFFSCLDSLSSGSFLHVQSQHGESSNLSLTLSFCTRLKNSYDYIKATRIIIIFPQNSFCNTVSRIGMWTSLWEGDIQPTTTN